MAWRMRDVEPGVDCAMRISLFRLCRYDIDDGSGFGVNVISLLFSPAPEIRALLASPSQDRDVRCWAFSPPPPDRLPRILSICTGVVVNADRQSAMRRSWPPPSRVVPGRWIGVLDFDVVAMISTGCVEKTIG